VFRKWKREQSLPNLSLFSIARFRFTNEEQSKECAFFGQIDFSRFSKTKIGKKPFMQEVFFENGKKPYFCTNNSTLNN
jgi:hypothetical protein